MKASVAAGLPLAIALLGGSALTTSTTQPQRIRAAHFSVLKPAANVPLSADDQQLAEENCVFGLPAKDPAWSFGPAVIISRRGYALEHSTVDKIPLWVCEHIERSQLSGSADRKDKFAADPKLQKGQRAELADYTGSGFDRGHMAPSANQKRSQQLNNETFFLSNMAPQVGQGFNRDVWAKLEDLTREWVKDSAVVTEWIITGPIFYDPAEEDPAKADGLVVHKVIGPDSVSVPTHFYKIVIGQTSDQKFKAVAFVLENKAHPSNADFEQFIKPIAWIEERTGLNFMPKLDESMEQQLEKKAGRLFE